MTLHKQKNLKTWYLHFSKHLFINYLWIMPLNKKEHDNFFIFVNKKDSLERQRKSSTFWFFSVRYNVQFLTWDPSLVEVTCQSKIFNSRVWYLGEKGKDFHHSLYLRAHRRGANTRFKARKKAFPHWLSLDKLWLWGLSSLEFGFLLHIIHRSLPADSTLMFSTFF